jgi:5'-nucleotidase/UDP-sugar diphosphatase
MRSDRDPPRRAALSLLALGLAALLGAAFARTPAAGGPDPWVHLVVIHTNDQHGALLPRTPAQAQVDATGPVGGYAALAAFVRAERAAAQASGAHLLLLDAGDVWTGTPEGQLTHGDLPVEALGRLGYDAVALGNHEFDAGLGNAVRLVEAARFPWISANVVDRATGRPPAWLRTHVVLDEGGVRVAVVGLTTSDTPRIVAGGDGLGLDFTPEAASAARAVEAIGSSADVILFLSHAGPERDREVLRRVPRVPLVVGGHSHTRLWRPIVARDDGTGWIVQAGTQCVVAGRVRLRVHRETKQVVLEDATLVPLVVGKVGSDPEAAAFLRERLDAIPDLRALDEVVTTLTADLARVGPTPEATSPAGSAIADAVRAASGADVAFHNRGAVRVLLPRGPVTRRDLWTLMPFDNTIVVVPMTGARIREVLAYGLGRDRATPLEVSGLEVTFRRGRGQGGAAIEWVSILAGGAPIEDAKTYRVAVNSFLAGGGDGYRVFASPDAKDTGERVRDAVRAHFARAPEFRPDTASRVRRVE